LAVDPNNADIVYAAGWNRIRNNNVSKISGPNAKIHKSIDGGETWRILDGGLPRGELTRIGIDMFAGDSDILVASYSGDNPEENCDGNGNQFYGLFKTLDGGETWTPVPTTYETGFNCGHQGGFAWYFGQVRVHPEDHNIITVLGVNTYQTFTNGSEWSPDFIFAPGEFMHVDFHAMQHVGEKTFFGSDGGAYVYDLVNETRDIENISTNQIYRIGYNPHEPDNYFGGLQDNGTVRGNGTDKNNYERVFGGDGFQSAFHPTDPDIFYVETQNGSIWSTTNGGENFSWNSSGIDGDTNWDMPYFISSYNPDVLFTGSERVYMNTQGPEAEWIPISDILVDVEDPLGFFEHNITTIDQSQLVEQNLYAGTSDGLVWRTTDMQNWDNVSNGLPRRFISNVKASQTFENTVYVSLTGFKNNDNTPLIYRSDENGDNWIPINGNLPNMAINDIYVLPDYNDQVLFVATEVGVYFTINAGESWERLGNNLPVIQVLDLEYNPVHNQIVAATFGRGIQSFDLEQVALEEASSSADLANNYGISVFPTSTSDVLNIDYGELASDNNISLSLFDLQGSLIQNYKDTPTQIDVTSLNESMYVLVLDNKVERIAMRFFKMDE